MKRLDLINFNYRSGEVFIAVIWTKAKFNFDKLRQASGGEQAHLSEQPRAKLLTGMLKNRSCQALLSAITFTELNLAWN